jgi:lipopolysaccharide/colanic/teichoic acid biosynthesis glycosyltransferase
MSALVDLKRSVSNERERGDRVHHQRARRGLKSVLSPERLRAQLACERALADRNGVRFSVVRLQLHWASRFQPLPTARSLSTVLSLVRTTDDVGWIDDRSLGLLLPNTSAAGAQCVAERISRALVAAGRKPQFEVCTYPTTLADAGKEPSQVTPRMPRETATDDEAKPMEGDFFVRPLPLWKRVMDVIGAMIALLLFSPVLVAAALAIKLTSPGPVIFAQRRTGLGGRVFKIYKFRTMCIDAEQKQDALRSISEQDGPAFKLRCDPRITRIGAMLRKTSIDELPQLANVLKGDMSLVGPRPLPVSEQQRSGRWHQRRLDVTPGMTCVWQIRGRNSVTFDQWVRMDVEYISTRSIWSDLKILVQTVPAILLKRGY